MHCARKIEHIPKNGAVRSLLTHPCSLPTQAPAADIERVMFTLGADAKVGIFSSRHMALAGPKCYKFPYLSFLTRRPVTRFTPFLLTDTFSQWHAAPYLPCGTHSYLVPPDSSTLLVCHGPLWSVRCRTLIYINPPSQSLKPQLELLVQSSPLPLYLLVC